MKTLTSFILLAFCFTSFSVTHASDGVAKVIIKKGKVTYKEEGSNTLVELKKGQWLQEGAVVQTEAKSFAKLLFIDKSTMNVGPKSEMKINQFPKEKAGIITLMKGQIRSKVTKDYMNIDKDKSKLFIKTKTAAMGVRGTDFQVGFNPSDASTSLDVISGAVAMAPIVDGIADNLNQDVLETAVSSPVAVMVEKGKRSVIQPGQQAPAAPKEIDKLDVKKLDSNENMVKEVSSADATPTGKQLPPGADPVVFNNEAAGNDGGSTSTDGRGPASTTGGVPTTATGPIAPPPPLEGPKSLDPGAGPEGGPLDPNAPLGPEPASETYSECTVCEVLPPPPPPPPHIENGGSNSTNVQFNFTAQ